MPVVPFGANDIYQIVQTPEAVMILYEVIHDARIIRMDGEHLSSNVRQWLGDSIGHWDADVLVVDTTNFNESISSLGSTGKLHVSERFSRIGARTLLYEATIEDPGAFTKPWTIEFPFVSTAQKIFEYACHEGNYSLKNILEGKGK